MHMWDRQMDNARSSADRSSADTDDKIGATSKGQKTLAAKHCIFRTHTHTHTHNYHCLTIHTRTTLLADFVP
jgi:hypothetical protein